MSVDAALFQLDHHLVDSKCKLLKINRDESGWHAVKREIHSKHNVSSQSIPDKLGMYRSPSQQRLKPKKYRSHMAIEKLCMPTSGQPGNSSASGLGAFEVS